MGNTAINERGITAADLDEGEGPLFVNMQTTPVGVYTHTGKKVYVLPWSQKPAAEKAMPSTKQNAIYAVRGNHYAENFSGKAGPLTVFLDRTNAVSAQVHNAQLGARQNSRPARPAQGVPAAPVAAVPAPAPAQDDGEDGAAWDVGVDARTGPAAQAAASEAAARAASPLNRPRGA